MSRFKVLYVDDEEINLELFKINFEKNYEVHIADNGNAGLEILSTISDIPVVLSDMKMPGMNGIEFIKAAKDSHPETKFFILTGFEINREIEEALDEGLIVKYFKKPYDRKELEIIINEAVEII